MRLPAAGWLVRLLGAVEVLIGTAALTVGGSLPAALVAASYAGFAAFVALAMARGGLLSTCGCFGKPDTPPTRLHLVMNLCAATLAGTVALAPGDRLVGVVGDQPLAGLPFLTLTGVCAWFAYLALAELPRLRPAATQR